MCVCARFLSFPSGLMPGAREELPRKEIEQRQFASKLESIASKWHIACVSDLKQTILPGCGFIWPAIKALSPARFVGPEVNSADVKWCLGLQLHAAGLSRPEQVARNNYIIEHQTQRWNPNKLHGAVSRLCARSLSLPASARPAHHARNSEKEAAANSQ